MDSAFWLMIAVVATAGITFVPVVIWLGNRQKESEARFHSEMARRIAESGDAGPVLSYVKHIERAEQVRVRTKTRLAGIIIAAAGIGSMVFLHAVGGAIYLAGLVPLLVGIAMLLASELMMRPKD